MFNLPDYRVVSVSVLADGRRRVIVETDQPPGCPACGVVASRRKERRFQRIRDIPVAGSVEVLCPWTRFLAALTAKTTETLQEFEARFSGE